MSINVFDLLIPLKGACIYIEETLISVSQSSILPSKTIIVDDGIDNAVYEKISKYQEFLNIEIIKNRGQGVAEASATGVEHSNAKFIARLDGDDSILPNRFETQLEYLSNHPQVIILGTRVNFIDKKSQFNSISHHPFGRLESLPNFKSECLLAQPSVMFDRSSILLAGNYRPKFKYQGYDLAEDFDLWRRASIFGEVHNLETPLTNYRQHNSQVSNKFNLANELITLMFVLDIDKELEANEIIDLDHFDDLKRVQYFIPRNESIATKIYFKYLCNMLFKRINSHEKNQILMRLNLRIIRNFRKNIMR